MPADIKNFLVRKDCSIKKVMQIIDKTSCCVAFVIDDDGKLVGAISDGDIRRAILRGEDINIAVKSVMNENPLFLTQEDLKDQNIVRTTVEKLQERIKSEFVMPVVIPVVDSSLRPVKLAYCSELLRVRSADYEQLGPVKKVLVVGGAGFLGSVLSNKLLDKGYEVRALDVLLYGEESIQKHLEKEKFELIRGDMRDISRLAEALVGVDAVINLAAIVGDPACGVNPSSTITTNYLANKTLAEACKYHQINRFLFASSCSVYGEKDDIADETSPMNPVSLYARSKIHSEEGILGLEDENFSPTILRMATLYGYSPRMRFDLVVNTMTKDAINKKEIIVHGGGTQWRPLLEVGDAADIFIKCLEAPLAVVKGQIFNAGSEKQNYQIKDIAEKVYKIIPEADLKVEPNMADNRNYSVSFAKIREKLNFTPQKDIGQSILEIREAITSKLIEDVHHKKYYNVEHIKENCKQPRGRLEKEAQSFDKIAQERLASGRLPDISRNFFNPYFYNNIWRSSDFVKQHYGASADWMIAQLRKQKIDSVVEFGCGDGWVCLELARAGFKVKGVDVSPESIKVAREYLDSLPEKEHLDLEYICQPALEYDGPIDSVVCHGFLHHLSPGELDSFIKKIFSHMRPGQVLIGAEPRYDKVDLQGALLVYALRQAFPNHFKYSGALENVRADLEKIVNELSEADKSQSEMDNESSSELILKTLNNYFQPVETEHVNAFYGKVIGSLRVSHSDGKELSTLLSKLDDLVVKYSPQAGRGLRFCAQKK